MNICMLTTSYIGEYAGDCIHALAKNLVRAGNHVTVLVPNRYGRVGEEAVDGVAVRRFHYIWPVSLQRRLFGMGLADSLSSPLFILQMPLIVLSFTLHGLGIAGKSDVLHCHWALSGLPGLILSKIAGKPMVCTFYGAEVYTGKFKRAVKLIGESADHVVFISTYTRDRTLAVLKPRSYSVIPPATLGPADVSVRPSSLLREKLGLPQDSLTILSLGRLVERKGLEYLIRALSLIEDEKIRLVIGGDGPLRDRLAALASELGLKERVILAGYVPEADKPIYFSGCDVYAMPSIVDSRGDTEGFGLVLAEAGLYGKPAVASRVGGIVDIIEDGVNGFLAEPKNPRSLADKIALLFKDGGLRERMGAEARSRSAAKFNPAKAAEETALVYRKVCSERLR